MASRRRKPKAKSQKSQKARMSVLSMLEEFGVIEAILVIIAIWSYANGIFILTAIAAFVIGVGLTYLVDKTRTNMGMPKHTYMRKEGVLRFIEEFGIAEIILFVLATGLFLTHQYIWSVVFSFVFGIAFTYLLDRSRIVMQVRRASYA